MVSCQVFHIISVPSTYPTVVSSLVVCSLSIVLLYKNRQNSSGDEAPPRFRLVLIWNGFDLLPLCITMFSVSSIIIFMSFPGRSIYFSMFDRFFSVYGVVCLSEVYEYIMDIPSIFQNILPAFCLKNNI